jgi:RimJ/RimL family protein N-acetyltransferase
MDALRPRSGLQVEWAESGTLLKLARVYVAPASSHVIANPDARPAGVSEQRHRGKELHNLNAPLQLETERLLLARPRSRDAEAIFSRYGSDPDVTRFLGWPRHRSLDDTQAFLAFSAQEWERWPAGPYLIWSRGSGQMLGGTGFGFQTPDEAVTGYVLAKDAWGKGYATEALTAIVQVAPGIAVKRLTAFCHPQHRASRRVLEKCGFVRDVTCSRQVEFPNLAEGRPQDVLCYEKVFDAVSPA